MFFFHVSLHQYQRTSRSAAPESLAMLASLTRKNWISFVCDTGLVLLLCWHGSSHPSVWAGERERLLLCPPAKVQKKKKERAKNTSAVHSPFTFHSISHRPIFWLERLNILNSFSLVVFSSRRTVFVAQWRCFTWADPPPPQHISGSGQVLRSKGLKRVIPNDRSAV